VVVADLRLPRRHQRVAGDLVLAVADHDLVVVGGDLDVTPTSRAGTE
jgi:hypothetical protein